MVDITSLKVRLARLRLGSEFEDKHPELADPVTIERKKKKKQKKAAQDPYNEYTKNTGGKRKKKNKLTRSDQKRGRLAGGVSNPSIDQLRAEEERRPKKLSSMERMKKKKAIRKKNIELYGDRTKLTRSDQKRGKKAADTDRFGRSIKKKKKSKRELALEEEDKYDEQQRIRGEDYIPFVSGNL